MNLKLISGLVLATFMATTPAGAEVFNVCGIEPTADGFVTLRDRPSAKGTLLARMHPGDMAVIDVKNGDYVQSGKWISIEFHRLVGKAADGSEDYKFVARGWAYSKYIDECG